MTTKTLNPAWLDRELFPFQSRSVDIAGNTVHYVDEGQGPVLLLLHGNSAYSFLYRNIIKQLSSQFRCIALDLPGFGLSTARAGFSFLPEEFSSVVESFVDQLKLRNIRLMVLDWGGPIGLGFAGRRPELIHSLFIGNTWAWPAQYSKVITRFSRIAGGPIGRFLTLYFNVPVNVLLPANSTLKLGKAEMAAYRGPFPDVESRRPISFLAAQILKSSHFLKEVENGLARLRNKQVALLWADKDPGFGEPELALFKKHFPHASVTTLHGARHFIQECAPDEISQAIACAEGNA